MTALIGRFKSLYRDLTVIPTEAFADVYQDDVIFRDPVHEMRGAADLLAYLDGLCQNLDYCQFEYLDEIIGEHSAYIKWNMNFRHPKLGDGVHTVRGMSHIQFNERIYYHEDIYDLGEMLYDHLPLLGGVTRWLKRRLAA